MSLNDIVTVTITRETTAINQASFNYGMILGKHTKFLDRLKWYSADSYSTEMAADGFSSSDAIYTAAQAYFSANPSPTMVAVGRIAATYQDVQIDTVANLSHYEVLIESVTAGTPTSHDYTSDGTALQSEIVDGLVALINAGAEASHVTASNVGDVLRITLDGSDPIAVTLGAGASRMTILDAVGTEDADDALDAIVLEDDTWYGLVLVDRTQAQVQLVADWIEAHTKIFATASATANIADQTAAGDSTTIAYYTSNSELERTFGLYNGDAATEYPDARWLGECLVFTPGTENWAFKTLSGQSADALTTTQQTNIWAKNWNTYQSIAGVGITQKGTCADGGYIDVIRFTDWLKARLQEEVFLVLVNSKKIPFTDPGIATILAAVKGVLQEAENNGALAVFDEDQSDYVTAPLASAVSAANKALRRLPDVRFRRRYSGAINEVVIEGVVSL